MTNTDSKQPIKIVRITSRLNLGGPTRQLLPLCRDLDSSRFRTHLVFGSVESDERESYESFVRDRVSIEKVDSLRRSLNPWHDFKAFFALWRILRREKPMILHTHLAKAGFLGRMAGVFAGVPIRVHSYHGVNFRGHFGDLKSCCSKIAERILSRFTKRSVAVSESVKQELLENRITSEAKICVIPPGLDLKPFLESNGRSGVLRKRFKISEDELLVGFIGRLVPVKNPNDFLAMAAAVCLMESNIRFVFIGDGPLRGDLADQVRSFELQDRIFFAGWREDMPACLSELDLVVSTSLSEGLPVSLIEAMAAAKPVVARSVGGIAELFDQGQFGVLAPAGESEELEGIVLSLLKDPKQRESLGLSAREWVRERYSASRLVADTEKLYKELIVL